MTDTTARAAAPTDPRDPRAIAAPERATRAGAAIVFAAVVTYAALMIAPPTAAPYLAAFAGALVVASAVTQQRAAFHASLLLGLLVAWAATVRESAWPTYLLGPLAAYAVAVRAVRPMRRSVGWLRRGRVDRTTLALIAATVAVSSAALVLWQRFTRPDLAPLLAQIPPVSTGGLIAAGVLFAVVNAALEEAIFRGVLLESLDAALGPGALSVAVQAASFGVAHLYGFPRGWLGVAMAGVYGLMLGAVRRRSRGMLAPFVAHVAADATVFAILVTVLRRGSAA